MGRPLVIVGIGLVVGAVIGWGYARTRTARDAGSGSPRPNVLLITVDTTRADHLGCYGYDRETSPNLDALAADGVLFEAAISQASNTPISHASIMTGQVPFHHGLRVMHGLVANKLPESATTLADVFHDAGFATAAFVSAYPVTAAFGFDQGFDTFNADFGDSEHPANVSAGGVVNTGLSQRRADDTTEAVLGWLSRRGASSPPYFLWVHYFDPHDPLLQPPNEVEALFPPRSMDADDRLRAIYDADVYYMDQQIGRLFAAIKAKGHWDDTIVVVVADHGEGLGDHNWWTHGLLYQEQIRVPLLMRIPGCTRAGQRVAGIVRSIDIAPTLLRHATIDPARWPAMDGEDLTPILEGAAWPSQRTAYSESVNMLTYSPARLQGAATVRRESKHDKLYAITTDTWKFIDHQLQPEQSELFNLATDPQETRNELPLQPQIATNLRAQLQAYDVFSPIMPGMTQSDYEHIERLRKLGYITEPAATTKAAP